jgi:hypothetical protein
MCWRIMAIRARSVSWLLAALLAAVAAGGDADQATEAPVDPAAKLVTMFLAGQYRQALAESEPLEKSLKPRGRDPQLIPRTKLWVDLLAFRGLIERRMGNLESAAAKYEAGFKALTDKDRRRLITVALRGDEKVIGLLVPLELTNVEVLDARVDVLLDSLATFDLKEVAANPEETAKILAAARRAADLAREGRAGLDERMGSADDSVQQSPYSLMLASKSRSLRAEARLALAESRLAGLMPKPASPDKPSASPDKAPPSPDKAPPSPDRAVAGFGEALVAAEAAMAPALPEPVEGATVPPQAPAESERGDVSPAIREAGLVRADLLAWRALAQRASKALGLARTDLAAALAWRRAVQGSNHPDLVEPLIWTADLALAEARLAVKARNIAEGSTRFDAATAALQEAQELLATHREQFVAESPLEEQLKSLLATVGKERQRAEELAGNANAVDAAAARVLRLLDALPGVEEADPAPK